MADVRQLKASGGQKIESLRNCYFTIADIFFSSAISMSPKTAGLFKFSPNLARNKIPVFTKSLGFESKTSI